MKNAFGLIEKQLVTLYTESILKSKCLKYLNPLFLWFLFIGSLYTERHYYFHVNMNILVQFLYKNFQDFLRILSWMTFKTRSNIEKILQNLPLLHLKALVLVYYCFLSQPAGVFFL